MPERWEDEIRKLRELRPRQDLDARVAEGPRGEPSLPTRQRVVAAVTALVVFVAAGFLVVRGFGTGTERPDPAQTSDAAQAEPVLVLELRSGDDAPEGSLRYGDAEQHGVVEGYSWCVGEECTSMIADFAFYPPASEYLVVPLGTTIEVTGDGALERLRFTDPNGEYVAGGASETVPDVDGQYQVGVEASWSIGEETGDAMMWFGVQVLSSPEAAPDVLRVDCGYGVARSDSAVVRTQADGLHLIFRGTDGFRHFEIVTPEGTPSAEISGIGGGFEAEADSVSPVSPGRWEVGCASRNGPVVAGDQTVAFELVDPDDHYAPAGVECRSLAAQEFASGIATTVPHGDAAAQLLTGLAPEDRLRGAGYDAESWALGPTYVVDRGGEAVAQLVLIAPETMWIGTFVACPGSGIALTEAATSPLPEEPAVPDVLVLRCEGLGPAVDADTVRLQPDGLHIEATNVADATVVALDPEDGTVEALVFPFETATEAIVADVPPGPLWVGCRVPDEQGEIAGGPSEIPDAYVLVTVLPTDA